MNHSQTNKQRGYSTLIRRVAQQQQRPATTTPAAAPPPAPAPAPAKLSPTLKKITADVAPYGIELLRLPRGNDVFLRLSLERYTHGPRVVATEWARSAEGFWYPRRSRSLALALDEEAAFDVAFAEARRRLHELPAEVQR